MTAFRIYLATIWVILVVYTLLVVAGHGPDLATVFLGDIAAVNWSGQFNLDFMMLLTLAGLWVAWRHQFSAGGIALGFATLLLGVTLLAPYLLWLTGRTGGDMVRVLIGQRADAPLRG